MTNIQCRNLSWALIASMLIIAAVTPKTLSAEPVVHALDTPIGPQGTVRFVLTTDQAWRDGIGQKKALTTLLEIPDMAKATISQSSTSVALTWQWTTGPRFQTQIPELPGPETYFLLFTWDAARGIIDAYLNGTPISTPNVGFGPWEFATSADEIHTFGSPATVSRVKATGQFTRPEDALAYVPKRLRGKHAELFGLGAVVTPLDVESRRGNVLVDNPLADSEDTADWVLEGPGQVDFQDGWMHMRSTLPKAKKPINGHIVHWCPEDFPESFVCEWDIQLLEDDGLTIVFFAAQGENGEDIFDPTLPERDGTFSGYTHGAVTSYHISYYANTPPAPGRITSNLRKNNKFLLMSAGPVAIDANSRKIHHMRLIKDGPHIQLQANGRVSIDFTDPGNDRYGPVYGKGKIGLRQMQWTVARYRNFRVWELLPE